MSQLARPAPDPPAARPETGRRHRAGGPCPGAPPGSDPVTDLVRWGAFGCALVPVTLLVCGTSFGGAAGTALALAAGTAVCRLLLRQSERSAVRLVAEEAGPHRGRHSRTGTGAHRGSRRAPRAGGRTRGA